MRMRTLLPFLVLWSFAGYLVLSLGIIAGRLILGVMPQGVAEQLLVSYFAFVVLPIVTACYVWK